MKDSMKRFRKFIIVLVVSWVFAFVVGWLIFGVFVPFLCTFLPANDWTGVMTLALYLIIGGMGGIAIPITIGVIGTQIAVEVL